MGSEATGKNSFDFPAKIFVHHTVDQRIRRRIDPNRYGDHYEENVVVALVDESVGFPPVNHCKVEHLVREHSQSEQDH